MVNKELREYLISIEEEIAVFDNPAYDECIIGISQDNRVIYSYEKLLEAVPEAWGLKEEENNPVGIQAADIISYDISKALNYMGEYKPIIMYEMEGYY